MNLRLEIETPLRDSITAAKLLDEQLDGAFSYGHDTELRDRSISAIYFLMRHLLDDLELLDEKWRGEDETNP